MKYLAPITALVMTLGIVYLMDMIGELQEQNTKQATALNQYRHLVLDLETHGFTHASAESFVQQGCLDVISIQWERPIDKSVNN